MIMLGCYWRGHCWTKWSQGVTHETRYCKRCNKFEGRPSATAVWTENGTRERLRRLADKLEREA